MSKWSYPYSFSHTSHFCEFWKGGRKLEEGQGQFPHQCLWQCEGSPPSFHIARSERSSDSLISPCSLDSATDEISCKSGRLAHCSALLWPSFPSFGRGEDCSLFFQYNSHHFMLTPSVVILLWDLLWYCRIFIDHHFELHIFAHSISNVHSFPLNFVFSFRSTLGFSFFLHKKEIIGKYINNKLINPIVDHHSFQSMFALFNYFVWLLSLSFIFLSFIIPENNCCHPMKISRWRSLRWVFYYSIFFQHFPSVHGIVSQRYSCTVFIRSCTIMINYSWYFERHFQRLLHSCTKNSTDQ